LADLFGLAGPLSIGLILAYVDDAKESGRNTLADSITNQTISQQENIFPLLTIGEYFTNGYILAVLVLIATFLQSIFSNNFNHLAISEGIHLRSALQVRRFHVFLFLYYFSLC
jgi:hypothetical protein